MNLDFHTKVVGVTFPNEDGTDRQDLIEELEDRIEKGETVELGLRREPHNVHDPNSVAVLDPDGRQLGFLSRQVVESVAPLMDRGGSVRASVAGLTGGLTDNYGVNIRVWSE